MIEFETELVDILQRSSNVKSFRFRVEGQEEFAFEAGQFFLVTIKIDGAERTKHFSFSNSPTEKGYLEFTKRITQSEYSQGLERLKIGDWARLKMPLGSFTLSRASARIAFLCGGIGITPVRSICKFATDRSLPTDIVLLYGNNTEADIIFKADLDQMARMNKALRLVYTLTSPATDKKSWPGRTGLIDDRMIKEEVPDYQERLFYLCGPPKMVQGLADILQNSLAISKDKIKTENFTGY